MSKHVNRLTKELSEMRDKVMNRPPGSSDSEDEQPPQIKTEEKVTEEMVERMEEKIESAQGDQKNLFLIIFQVRCIKKGNRNFLIRSNLKTFFI